MCGEMAGDPYAVPVLLGLGLDEFSMSATSILPARKIVNSLSKKEMEELAAKALTLDTACLLYTSCLLSANNDRCPAFCNRYCRYEQAESG